MEQERFTNKVCLVTGDSSGVGKATAMQFAKEGGKVVILNRDIEEGEATAKKKLMMKRALPYLYKQILEKPMK